MTTPKARSSEVNENMDGGEKTAELLKTGKFQEKVSTKSEVYTHVKTGETLNEKFNNTSAP